MEYFDLLPPQLRLACRQAVHRTSAPNLYHAYHTMAWQSGDPRALARAFAVQAVVMDHKLVADFAATFKQRYGREYPHTAAKATILYSEILPAY